MSWWYQWFMPAPMMTIERPLVFSAFSANPRATAIALSAADAGDRLLPGGRVRHVVVVASCASAAETAIKAVIGAKQVEDGRHMRLAVGERDTAHRDVAQQHIAALIVLREVLVQLAAEIGKRDRHHVVATVDQAQREPHVLAASRHPLAQDSSAPSASPSAGQR